MAKLKKTTNTKSLAITDNKYLNWGMLAVFLVCMFSVTSYKIEDDDFFWHLSTGKYITENGTVPSTDVFGYATTNAEWIPFEWAADVIFYHIYKISGYNGVFIFRSLIFCIIFLIYFRLLNKLNVNSTISIILFFVLLIGLFDRFSPRPHIFTYLFLSLIVYLLLNYKYVDREKYFKRLYALPVIFLIWGNLHLGVITGVFLFFLFILSELIIYKYPQKFGGKDIQPVTQKQLKILLILFVVSIAVLLINPHGIKTYTYAYSHTQMKMLEQIAEWLSPFTGKVEGTFVLTLYKVLLFSGIIVIIYSYKKKDLLSALLCIGFAFYSVRAIRFIVDYELVIIPLLAVSLNYFLLKQNKKLTGISSKILYSNVSKSIIILLLGYLAIQFQSDSFYISLKYNREAGLGISNRYFPLQLYKFMKDNNIKGTPFNNFDTGGYFKWEFPEQKIFIDSRNINDEIFSEYFSILSMKPGFDNKLEKYGVDYVIFFEPKLSRYPNILKQQVTEFLLNNKNWALVYWDDLSMVFLKRTQENNELISKYEYKVFNPYTAVFKQKEFEANVVNFPSTLETEMKRKSLEEPNGYFYLGMNDIVRKVSKK